MKLGKIFKISGDFMRNGAWSEPSPAFAGEIVASDDGKFCGWCEQFRAEEECCGDPRDLREANKSRHLFGAIEEEGDGYSLLFFKLATPILPTPLLYEIHAASPEDCVWMAKDPGFSGGFVAQGNARVSLEELPYSGAVADRIKNRFHEMGNDNAENDELIQKALSWQKKSLVLWA